MKILLIEDDPKEYSIKVIKSSQDPHMADVRNVSFRERQSDHIEVIQAKDISEACDKLDCNPDIDLILVDYFHEKRIDRDDDDAQTKHKKDKALLMKKVQLLQETKDKIRGLQDVIWNCDGKNVAIRIKDYIWAKNGSEDQIPVALYSRHAKTLMRTDELFPLFEKGIYLAWKPKYFGFERDNDAEKKSSHSILKSEYDKKNQEERDFLKDIVISSRIRNKLHARQGEFTEIVSHIRKLEENEKKDTLLSMIAAAISIIIAIVIYSFMGKEEHTIFNIVPYNAWIGGVIASIMASVFQIPIKLLLVYNLPKIKISKY